LENYTLRYSDIRKPNSLRAKARNLALNVLIFKQNLKGIEKYLVVPRIQFLYIHHAFADELTQLDQLMQVLSKYHTFISHSEAVERILNNQIDKPYIVLSTDDGFKNNIAAAQIFNKYNAKACFFINPGLIDEHDFETIKTHCKVKLHLPPVEFLTWQDVNELLAQGHEIGAHTMYHDNIANMSEQAIEEDMKLSYEILNKNCGPVKHFAFPYGRFSHFNKTGKELVFKVGYQTCSSAERGCHIPSSSELKQKDLCIRRDHVILDWPMDHIIYFLVNNVKNRSEKNNYFPY
jgi:peptidoglycan/xylan/chitin deacetylase (PgdA/CDA1 family)